MRTERDWDDLQAQAWSAFAENEKLRARLAAAEKRAEEAEATIAEFRKEHAMWAEVNRVQLDKRDKLIGELRCDLHLLETERGDEVARGLEAEDTHKATRARLAAAEAVIAALPMCDHPGCGVRSMYYYGETTRHCEVHRKTESYNTSYSAPLRAYLALGKGGGK